MSVVQSVGTAPEAPSRGGLSDVVGLILDKGLVIDVFLRVSLIGIEVVTVDARVVVASVDTYMRFAERAGRMNLEATRRPGLPEMIHGIAAARAKPPAAQLTPPPQAPQVIDQNAPKAATRAKK
jgi:gas vesicle structural protein